MEVANIFQDKEQSRIYGLMGNIDITTNNKNYSIVTNVNIKDTVREYLSSKKDKQALKMVMLDESYLEKEIYLLNKSNQRRVALARALIDNKPYIVLDFFEKDFNSREKDAFLRLFKKISTEYKKTIIIYTNDISFIWNIASEIVLVDDEITSYKKGDYFNILEKIDKPKLAKMVELIRSKGIKIEDYQDPKDLLKAIYRIKESKL